MTDRDFVAEMRAVIDAEAQGTYAVPIVAQHIADNPTHPYLVRAYRGRSLVGYAIRDGYGWAIVGSRQGRMRTVDRFDPLHWSEPEATVRDAAVRGLFRFAVTGSTGDGFWDLPYQRGAR